jgi:hypothetical protein
MPLPGPDGTIPTEFRQNTPNPLAEHNQGLNDAKNYQPRRPFYDNSPNYQDGYNLGRDLNLLNNINKVVGLTMGATQNGKRRPFGTNEGIGSPQTGAKPGSRWRVGGRSDGSYSPPISDGRLDRPATIVGPAPSQGTPPGIPSSTPPLLNGRIDESFNPTRYEYEMDYRSTLREND